MLQNNTKIIATLGPASTSEENLEALIKEGVAIFRLNFSHGNHQDHKSSIDKIIRLNEKLGTHVGILADLQGRTRRHDVTRRRGCPRHGPPLRFRCGQLGNRQRCQGAACLRARTERRRYHHNYE